jgi:hypothetical protein
MAGTPSPITVREDQLTFARHNFDNQQSLIRAADTKAGLYVTLILFLGAVTIPLGKDVVPRLSWVPCGGAVTSAAYIVSYVVFAAGFIWSLMLVRHVVTPRSARHYADPQPGHELHFYKHVLLHRDNAEYFQAVQQAPPELLLRNLTDQIFELAYICDEKMTAVRAARAPITLTFFAWLVNAGFGLWIARWK